MIQAVVIDVGETLIDESRIWGRWADRLGVPPLTLMGLLGGMAALDRSHRDALELIRPGFDLARELERWALDDPDSLRERFDEDDLYPDVRPGLDALVANGLSIHVAGNQPPAARETLLRMNLPVSSIFNSHELGAEKPSPEFFNAVIDLAGGLAPAILYVGDRLDNDVLPARRAGMRTVLMRRGPWGYLHAERPEAGLADAVCNSLLELPLVVEQIPH
ncbi:MAG: HAD family hydrolase [Acidimicrobiia bacterium]|nr:HAD family hydrolase [Acidimicrobiia bacterium]MDQ3501026.1 HAD family hydrolase [Actinomycetota bacterium]